MTAEAREVGRSGRGGAENESAAEEAVDAAVEAAGEVTGDAAVVVAAPGLSQGLGGEAMMAKSDKEGD